jgi:class 3 adenylate cyclase
MGGPELGGRAVTAMFTDIVDSTASAVTLGDRRWREIRNAHHDVIRRGLRRFSGSEVDTSGDGFFATFERPSEALSCACVISDEVRSLGIDVRIGLHADGAERQDLEFLFIAVANRVSSLATGGEILITGTMKSLLTESTIPLESRGTHVLRGVPGEWDIFAVERSDSDRPAKAPIPIGDLDVNPRDLPHRSILTLMFTDMLGATVLAAKLGDLAWREVSTAHDALITQEVTRYGGIVVDTAGDQFFATFDRPVGAISSASAIQDGAQELGVPVRIGLHAGEVEDMGDKVGGIAVHIGARVRALASAGEILVSSTVKDLVEGSGLRFEERGQHDLKGLPGVRSVFALETRPPPAHSNNPVTM